MTITDWDQSYPPHLFIPIPTDPVISGVVVGSPGYFVDQYSDEIDPPPDLTALRVMGFTYTHAPWQAGNYVALGDGSNAHWDGDSWEEGITALADPPPPETCPDPTGFEYVGGELAWVPDGAMPAHITGLRALHIDGDGHTWAPGESLELGNGERASWDGEAWQRGARP